MIYLASPFTHPDSEMMHYRYTAAYRYCAQQMQLGNTIFSPIVYGYVFWVTGHAEANHHWWRDFNEHMLITAQEMHVLCLLHWEDSQGIAHEIDFAQRHGIPVIKKNSV